MGPLLAWELANTVTGFATALSGLTALILCGTLGRQPGRWLGAYAMMFVTGVFTVTYHGLGETHGWKVLDNGTNLLLVASIHHAILGDFASPQTRIWGRALTWALNLSVVALMTLVPSTTEVQETVTFGAWGGYMVGEIVLIADAVAALLLFVRYRAEIPARAGVLLRACAAAFAVGAALSTAGNDVVVARLYPLHALWHLVSAFGFLLLWAANHHRFVDTRPR